MSLDTLEEAIRRRDLQKLEEIRKNGAFLGSDGLELASLIREAGEGELEVRRYDHSSKDSYLLVTNPRVIRRCGDAGKDYIWRILCYWKERLARTVNELVDWLERMPSFTRLSGDTPGVIVGYDRDSGKYFVNKLTPYQAAAIAIGGYPESYEDLQVFMGFHRHHWEPGEPVTGERVRVQGDIVVRFLYVDPSEKGENARDLAAWIASVERAVREAPKTIVRLLRTIEDKLRSLSLDYSLPMVSRSLAGVIGSIVETEISKIKGDRTGWWSVSAASVSVDAETRIVNVMLGRFDPMPFCTMEHFRLSTLLLELCDEEDAIKSCVSLLPVVLAEVLLARTGMNRLVCSKERSVRALSTHQFLDRGWLVSISLGAIDGLYSKDFANLTRTLATRYFDEESKVPLGREEFSIGNHRVTAEPARLVRATLTGQALMAGMVESALEVLENTILCTHACCGSDKYRMIIEGRLGDDQEKRWAVADALLALGYAQRTDHLLLLGPGARMVLEHEEHGLVELRFKKASLIAFESIPS